MGGYLFQNMLADQLRCLSLGEREQSIPRCDGSRRSGWAKAQRTVLPLLGEREKTKRHLLLVPWSPILRTPLYGNEILAVRPETRAHLAHRRHRERTGQGCLSRGLCRV